MQHGSEVRGGYDCPMGRSNEDGLNRLKIDLRE